MAKDLAALAAERARGAWAAAHPEGHALSTEEATARADTLLELPGAELRIVDGEPVFLVRREVKEIFPDGRVQEEMSRAIESWASRDAGAPRGLRDIAVLDLETAGLWGCPLFVTAFLFEEEGKLVTLQLVTRTYAEEAAVVRASAEYLTGRSHLITFNGKSFDVPFLAERATYHRVPFDVSGMFHLDLLHPARRLYRGYFPDCRLQTLERMLLGIRRVGDIASAEIPAVFHQFVATGEIERVKDVLHHSRIDVISTGLLLGKMAQEFAATGSGEAPGGSTESG